MKEPDQVKRTIDHTLQTLSGIQQIFNDPKGFASEFNVDISKVNIEGTDHKQLLMLMFIHDFYKLTEQKEHAARGADFLAQPENIALIRYHDALGIIHTGEASLRFLFPLIELVKTLSPEKRNRILRGLVVLTISDVASLGFLNDARIDTYQKVIAQIEQVIAEGDLDKVVKDDTADRLQHLISSNNRCSIERKLIEKCSALYPERERFKDIFQYVRFDAGVYVLEPLLRYLLPPPYSGKYRMEFKDDIAITDEAAVRRWIEALYKLIKDVPQDKQVHVLDLNDRSLKNDAHVEAFDAWAKQF